jgi:hypothetical protein
VQDYSKAKEDASAPYLETAREAGLNVTRWSSSVTTIVYYLTAGMELKDRKRVTDAMNKVGRNRYKEVQNEMKKRGVNRDSPEYKGVYAQVNATVSARVRKKQIAEIRKHLPKEKTAVFDELLPAWEKVEEAHRRLAQQVADKITAVIGLDTLLGKK